MEGYIPLSFDILWRRFWAFCGDMAGNSVGSCFHIILSGLGFCGRAAVARGVFGAGSGFGVGWHIAGGV